MAIAPPPLTSRHEEMRVDNVRLAEELAALSAAGAEQNALVASQCGLKKGRAVSQSPTAHLLRTAVRGGSVGAGATNTTASLRSKEMFSAAGARSAAHSVHDHTSTLDGVVGLQEKRAAIAAASAAGTATNWGTNGTAAPRQYTHETFSHNSQRERAAAFEKSAQLAMTSLASARGEDSGPATPAGTTGKKARGGRHVAVLVPGDVASAVDSAPGSPALSATLGAVATPQRFNGRAYKNGTTLGEQGVPYGIEVFKGVTDVGESVYSAELCRRHVLAAGPETHQGSLEVLPCAGRVASPRNGPATTGTRPVPLYMSMAARGSVRGTSASPTKRL
jgi:hypothetical protein